MNNAEMAQLVIGVSGILGQTRGLQNSFANNIMKTEELDFKLPSLTEILLATLIYELRQQRH